jgi:phenylalanyl-tRNA synthetase alpha chain
MVSIMSYQNPQVQEVAELLKSRIPNLENKQEVLRAVELKALYDQLKTLSPEERSTFGKEVNDLRQELTTLVNEAQDIEEGLLPLDITAPFDINSKASERPVLMSSQQGSIHPISSEIEEVLNIFYRMGFTAYASREIDDDYHMFGALNFPEGHPARDDYDTFQTEQKDKAGNPLIAPAHTSTMQNRVLKELKPNLEKGLPIAAVIPDRVFRNEDLDARHEHTFYQLEGVYVDKGINAGNLIATLSNWLKSYYEKDLKIKTQPFYFPFTEPSFEFAASCIFCEGKGCSICSHTGWIELGGCGMIHPNVLKEASIDSREYSGFAWGFGIERLVMLKYNVEDVRHFEDAKLDFLRQFS